jgi:flagellar hook-basal body protein
MSIMGASVSGMQADTNWLSSISQNVANASTDGYKRVITNFSTLVDESSDLTENVTGVTTKLHSLNTLQGSVVATSTPTNLAVQGRGFFVVADGGGAEYLTRNGTFVPDAAGDLVNAAGYYLMGFDLTKGTGTAATNSMQGLTRVNVTTSGQTATPTTTGILSANLPAAASAVPAAQLPSTNAANAQYTAKTSLVSYDNLGAQHTLDIQHGPRYLGGRGVRSFHGERVRRISLFGGSLDDADADVQRRQRQSRLGIADLDPHSQRTGDVARPEFDDAARGGLLDLRGFSQRQCAEFADQRRRRARRHAVIPVQKRRLAPRLPDPARQRAEPRQSDVGRRRRLQCELLFGQRLCRRGEQRQFRHDRIVFA